MSRLLLVTQQLRQVRSGVGTYARALVEGVREQGWDLHIATWDDEVDPEINGVGYLPLGRAPRTDPTPGAFWTLGRRAARALRTPEHRGHFDLVHFLDAREAHAYRGSTPTIGTVHDDYAIHAPRSPQGLIGRAADPVRRWLYYTYLRRLEKRCYARFDRLLANSTATRDSVVSAYGVASDRVDIVSLCLPEADEGLEALVLAGKPALLFVGGNFYRKGLDLVVRALPRLVRRLPGLRLHVAGRDPAQSKIMALADELGVADFVEWHGRVPAERALAMTHGCDVFVMPSRREALGLVYLEAFRAAVPVIAGREGGVADIVRDGVSGLCASTPNEIAEAVLRLGDDALLRSRLVAAGLEVVRGRTPERLVQETLSAYERVTQLAPESGEEHATTSAPETRAAESAIDCAASIAAQAPARSASAASRS